MLKKRLSCILLCFFAFLPLMGLQAQDSLLTPAWELEPNSVDFLTGDNSAQRGMAYNPETGNLLLASRSPGVAVHVIRADDGEVLGELSTSGVSGGTFVLNKIAVAEDGTIYAGNLTLDSESSPFRLYRWEDEQADPVPVFAGDPSEGDSNDANRRFGDSIAVRGTGDDTEILLTTWDGSIFSLLTPAGENEFEARALPTPLPDGDVRNLTFEGENLLYGSHPGRPFYELEFNPEDESEPVTILRSFDGTIIASDIAPVAFSDDGSRMAAVRTSSNAVALWQRSHLTDEWTVPPIASHSFSPDNTNGNGTAAIAFVGDRIYALNTNNGVIALDVGDDTPDPVEPGEIYWTNSTSIRTAERDGSNPRTVLGGLTRAIGIAVAPDGESIYYADDGAGIIGRVNLDGSGQEIILSGRANPQFLAVQEDRLYWAEWNHGLLSSDLDGSDVQDLIVFGAGGQSTSVTVGDHGSVYLGVATGDVYRPTGDPANPELVAELGVSGTYGLRLDSAADTFYATSISNDLIYYHDLNAGAGDTIYSDQDSPLGIDLSQDRTELFWVQREGGLVVRGSVTGNETPTILVSGEDSPFGIAVLHDLAEEETFDSWIARFDLPAGQMGPGDDPDGDGVENALEYALSGGHPAEADRGVLPAIGFEGEGDEDYLSLAVSKNPDAVGVTYIVEVSSDLQTWDPDGTTMLEESDTFLLVRDNVPLNDGDRRFIRLRVELE